MKTKTVCRGCGSNDKNLIEGLVVCNVCGGLIFDTPLTSKENNQQTKFPTGHSEESFSDGSDLQVSHGNKSVDKNPKDGSGAETSSAKEVTV